MEHGTKQILCRISELRWREKGALANTVGMKAQKLDECAD